MVEIRSSHKCTKRNRFSCRNLTGAKSTTSRLLAEYGLIFRFLATIVLPQQPNWRASWIKYNGDLRGTWFQFEVDGSLTARLYGCTVRRTVVACPPSRFFRVLVVYESTYRSAFPYLA